MQWLHESAQELRAKDFRGPLQQQHVVKLNGQYQLWSHHNPRCLNLNLSIHGPLPSCTITAQYGTIWCNMVQYSMLVCHAHYPSSPHRSWVAHARVLLPHHARDHVLLVGPNDHRNALAGGSSRSLWRHSMFEEIVKRPQCHHHHHHQASVFSDWWTMVDCWTAGLVDWSDWTGQKKIPKSGIGGFNKWRGRASHQIQLSCSSKAKMSPFSVTTCRKLKPSRSIHLGTL